MDGYLLENGIDKYQMEDGLGVLLLETVSSVVEAIYSTQITLTGLGS